MDILSRDQFSRSIRGKMATLSYKERETETICESITPSWYGEEAVIMVKLDDVAIF
jgi:hypothetical protein